MCVLSRGCQVTQVAWGEVVAGDLRSHYRINVTWSLRIPPLSLSLSLSLSHTHTLVSQTSQREVTVVGAPCELPGGHM